MCKFAYTSDYEKILTDIRSYVRGIDLRKNIIINEYIA